MSFLNMSAPSPIPMPSPRTSAETPAQTATLRLVWRLGTDWAEGAMEAVGRMRSDKRRARRVVSIYVKL